jgi:hypothetical protein
MQHDSAADGTLRATAVVVQGINPGGEVEFALDPSDGFVIGTELDRERASGVAEVDLCFCDVELLVFVRIPHLEACAVPAVVPVHANCR